MIWNINVRSSRYLFFNCVQTSTNCWRCCFVEWCGTYVEAIRRILSFQLLTLNSPLWLPSLNKLKDDLQLMFSQMVLCLSPMLAIAQLSYFSPFQKFLVQYEHLCSTQIVVTVNRLYFLEYFRWKSFLLNNNTSPLPAYYDTIHIFGLFQHPFTHVKLILGGVNSTSFTQNVAKCKMWRTKPTDLQFT